MNDTNLSTFVSGLSDPNQIALTFDDGPSVSFTPELLQLLRGYNVRATFFLIGGYVEAYPDLVRTIFLQGHAIGNHTYSHPRLPTAPDIQLELVRCRDAINTALAGIGRVGWLFRAPYGDVDARVLQAARRLGLKHVHWSLDPRDYTPDPDDPNKPLCADTIVTRAAEALDAKRMGEIVLLHDSWAPDEVQRPHRVDRSQTLLAVQRLLAMYAGKREFVTPDF